MENGRVVNILSRGTVRCIAVTDIMIGLFLILIYGGIVVSIIYERFNMSNISQIVLFFLIGISALQLIMGIVLMTSTYQNNNTIALSRCKKWHQVSTFLCFITLCEILILIWSQGSPWMSILKLLFRLYANNVSNKFEEELTQIWPWPIIFTPPAVVTHPSYPIQNTQSDTIHRIVPNRISIPSFDSPPTYEEAVQYSHKVDDIKNSLPPPPYPSSNSSVNKY